jgi:hypothetical protein
VAAPQPDRAPADPGEHPGTDVLTQAFVLALILTLAQEKVKEVFQQNQFGSFWHRPSITKNSAVRKRRFIGA